MAADSGDVKTSKNYYEMLGVERDASAVQLLKKYSALKATPSKRANLGELEKAYETLADPGKRAEYDKLLAEGAKQTDVKKIETKKLEEKKIAEDAALATPPPPPKAPPAPAAKKAAPKKKADLIQDSKKKEANNSPELSDYRISWENFGKSLSAAWSPVVEGVIKGVLKAGKNFGLAAWDGAKQGWRAGRMLDNGVKSIRFRALRWALRPFSFFLAPVVGFALGAVNGVTLRPAYRFARDSVAWGVKTRPGQWFLNAIENNAEKRQQKRQAQQDADRVVALQNELKLLNEKLSDDSENAQEKARIVENITKIEKELAQLQHVAAVAPVVSPKALEPSEGPASGSPEADLPAPGPKRQRSNSLPGTPGSLAARFSDVAPPEAVAANGLLAQPADQLLVPGFNAKAANAPSAMVLADQRAKEAVAQQQALAAAAAAQRPEKRQRRSSMPGPGGKS
jgi:hypothetical protein